MAPLKSSLTRALRSKIPTQNPRRFDEANRALAGTTRNVTSAPLTSKLTTPSMIIPRGKSFSFISQIVKIVKISQTGTHTPFSNPRFPFPKPNFERASQPRTSTPQDPTNALRHPTQQHHQSFNQHTTILSLSSDSISSLFNASIRIKPLALGQIRTRQSGQTIHPESRLRSPRRFQSPPPRLDAGEEKSGTRSCRCALLNEGTYFMLDTTE